VNAWPISDCIFVYRCYYIHSVKCLESKLLLLIHRGFPTHLSWHNPSFSSNTIHQARDTQIHENIYDALHYTVCLLHFSFKEINLGQMLKTLYAYIKINTTLGQNGIPLSLGLWGGQISPDI